MKSPENGFFKFSYTAECLCEYRSGVKGHSYVNAAQYAVTSHFYSFLLCQIEI